MVRRAEQDAQAGTILAPGDRLLVVTAGRGDRGDVAVRVLERLGASCALLDVSSAGREPAALGARVRDAYEQLSGGAPGARRIALVGVGWGAGPALTAAGELAEISPLPAVLNDTGRFEAGARPFSPLGGPALLLLDGDPPRRVRALQRAVAAELGDGAELVVLHALADEGEDVLRSWGASAPLPASRGASAAQAEPRFATPLGRTLAMLPRAPRRSRTRRTA